MFALLTGDFQREGFKNPATSTRQLFRLAVDWLCVSDFLAEGRVCFTTLYSISLMDYRSLGAPFDNMLLHGGALELKGAFTLTDVHFGDVNSDLRCLKCRRKGKRYT